jgi:predicted ATP-grasp superfamily ATP-dependent carboligase
MNPTFSYIIHRSGETIAAAAGLRGLWGFDFIYDIDIGTYPVELNPRYTASVEVLEHGLGESVFGDRFAATQGRARPLVGKAIYYAPHDLGFPTSGPWDADLALPFDPWRLPRFADIPSPGSMSHAGQPVVTIFEQGSSAAECRQRLQSRARELDQLFGKHRT